MNVFCRLSVESRIRGYARTRFVRGLLSFVFAFSLYGAAWYIARHNVPRDIQTYQVSDSAYEVRQTSSSMLFYPGKTHTETRDNGFTPVGALLILAFVVSLIAGSALIYDANHSIGGGLADYAGAEGLAFEELHGYEDSQEES